MFLKSKWQLFIVLHKTDSNEIPGGTKNKKNKTWDLATEYKGAKEYNYY